MNKILLIALFALLLAGCADAEPPNEDSSEPAAARPSDPTPTPEPAAARPSDPTPTPEPTDLPAADGHDLTHWHPPSDGHHHGHDPMQTIFADYIAANWTQTIGHAWQTSPAENEYPYPGKHEGFKYLYEADTNCDQFRNEDPSSANCIRAYLMQVHSLGTAHAIRTRHHSLRGLFLVCGPGGAEPCDIVEVGGHEDYGTFHTLYKDSICTDDPANPPIPDRLVLDQPPYRAINHHARQNFAWSSLVNPVAYRYFDPVPQQHLEVVWAEQGVWSAPHPDHCMDPAHDIITGENGTKYFVSTILLNIAQFSERPLVAFTDVHGNLNPSCTADGPTCVPIYIGADVPLGDASLNRPVSLKRPGAPPILDFDDGTPLTMPGQHLQGQH